MDSVYSINIERAVLSSILFNPEEIEEIISILQSKDFYLPAHQKIFEAMLELYKDNMPIAEEFIRKKVNLKDVDDSILIEILSANPISNTLAYVKEIKDASIKRELSTLATTIKKVSFEEQIPASEALNTVQEHLYKISTDNTTSEVKDIQVITNDTLNYIKKMKEMGNQHLIGETTGFHELNKKTTGFNEGDLVIIAARPSMGKCLGKGTKVVMYDGTLKNVEDIIVGDQLMGNDSKPRNVLSTTRGQEQMYWIRQHHGIDYRVNESHIISLQKNINEENLQNSDILNINIKKYLQNVEELKKSYQGYKVEIEFKDTNTLIEPYFLGLWLSIGNLQKPYIHSKDKEITEYVKIYLTNLKEDILKNQALKHHIKNNDRNKENQSFLEQLLKDENLLKNKYIPQNYIQNSKIKRLQLLAGLIDGYGVFNKADNNFEIKIQNNKILAKQIKYLCDTLGFRTLFIKSNLYKILIYGNINDIPTKIIKKRANKWSGKQTWKQTHIKIEKDIVDEYFGFELDGNKLFLLEDMTVTHNTALVLNMALSNIELNKGVIFFSLEMPAEQLMLRMLSIKTSIPLQSLRKGDMDDQQWSNLSNAFENLNKRKFFVDDGGSININQLRARVRKLAQNEENNISLVIVDYLQLMQGTQNKDRHQEVSDISRGLKMLAREMKIPVIALSQLNRGVESRPEKRPMLSDLRESGAIEQDADIIMFVYRDDVYKERDEARKEKEAKDKGEDYKSKFINKVIEEAEIIIGKQRNGPIGTVKLDFQKEFTRFVDKQNSGNAPIEVIFESIADTNKETIIDIPQII